MTVPCSLIFVGEVVGGKRQRYGKKSMVATQGVVPPFGYSSEQSKERPKKIRRKAEKNLPLDSFAAVGR